MTPYAAEIVLSILVIIALLVCLILYIGSLVWLYQDANRRGGAGCLLVALVALFAWPIGVFIWLLARPPLTVHPPAIQRRDGTLECPECRFLVVPGDPRCPNCGRKF